MARLRLAFMGSPDFSVPALRALAHAHDVVAVYCQPPKPAHRGQHETPCPVHRAALELGIAVRTPRRLRGNAQAAAEFAALDLDAAVVAAYGLILPRPFLDAPKRGCLNIHASLLPRWRGAAPIQAAILAGDAESGITIMRMEEGLDTGPMLLAEATAISETDTAGRLHDRLAEIGPRLILAALTDPPAETPQDEALATYAPKLSRADSPLDFGKPSEVLARQIRAFNPWPGSTARLGGTELKILAARAEPSPDPDAAPGTALDNALLIACGSGTALRLLRLQRPGRAPLDGAEFLRGYPIPAGTILA